MGHSPSCLKSICGSDGVIERENVVGMGQLTSKEKDVPGAHPCTQPAKPCIGMPALKLVPKRTMRPLSSYTGNTLAYLMADSESATTLQAGNDNGRECGPGKEP